MAQGDREIVNRRPPPLLGGPAARSLGGRVVEAGGGHEEGNEGEGETCSVVRLSCFEEDVKVGGSVRCFYLKVVCSLYRKSC